MTSWLVSIGVAIVGWIVTLSVYGKYKKRISYWL
jgi:lipopolysaccharide transport system permease protein